MSSCISYRLLCNKVPQNLAAWNNRYSLCHSFCGAGLWEGLSWVLCPRASQEVVVKLSASLPGCSHFKGLLGLECPLSHGCWQASIPCHVGLSIGCLCVLMTSQLVIPGAENTKAETSLFVLISEMTCHCFYCILIIKSKSINPGHTEREEMTQRQQRLEHREAGLAGGVLEAACHKSF